MKLTGNLVTTLLLALVLPCISVASRAAEPVCEITGAVDTNTLAQMKATGAAGPAHLPLIITVRNTSGTPIHYRIHPAYCDGIFLYRHTWLGISREHAFPYDPDQDGSHHMIPIPPLSGMNANTPSSITITLAPGESHAHKISVPMKYLKPLGQSVVAGIEMDDTSQPRQKWEKFSKPFHLPAM